MARRKPEIKLESWGVYDGFDDTSDKLPKIIRHTLKIPAQIGIEFGYMLRIRKAKNALIRFEINHPPFPDDDGTPAPPFTGDLYVRNNDYRFFLGDTLWEPIENKIGPWRLTTWIDEKQVMCKTFDMQLHHRLDDNQDDGTRRFMQL